MGDGDAELPALELAGVDLAQAAARTPAPSPQAAAIGAAVWRVRGERADEQAGERLAGQPLARRAPPARSLGREPGIALAFDELELLAGHRGGRGAVADEHELGRVRRRLVCALVVLAPKRHGRAC